MLEVPNVSGLLVVLFDFAVLVLMGFLWFVVSLLVSDGLGISEGVAISQPHKGDYHGYTRTPNANPPHRASMGHTIPKVGGR